MPMPSYFSRNEYNRESEVNSDYNTSKSYHSPLQHIIMCVCVIQKSYFVSELVYGPALRKIPEILV